MLSKATPRMLAVLAFLLALLPVMPVSAQPVVAPGETLVFTEADGGSAECRRIDGDRACTNPRFRLGLLGETTRAEPADNFVAAIIEPEVGIGIGAVTYATASVFNDFSVSNSVDGVVRAQVSATWDLSGFVGGGLAYNADINLFLIVLDVTDGTPVALASQTLNTIDRDSEQGFELAAEVGGEEFALRDEAASILVGLRRGRDYRIVFQARAAVSTLLLGLPNAIAEAVWTDLRVTIDEDEFEQTAIHDREIKARLDIIDTRQEEILRLLHTPQGQRNTEFPACDGEPCDWPENPSLGPGQSGDAQGLAEFCSGFSKKKKCKNADFENDEPGAKPRDCRFGGGVCVPF